MKRRLIALLLCISLIGSMTVYATDDVTEPTEDLSLRTSPQTGVAISNNDTDPTVPTTVGDDALGVSESEPTSEPTVPATTVGDDALGVPESEPTSEPTVSTTVGDDAPGVPESESTSEPTVPETSAPVADPTEPSQVDVPAGPAVGDTIYIKSGSKVYKTAEDKNGWSLWGNYKIKIVNILTDATNAPAWYEFEFTSLGIGEWLLREYKYVKVENTTVTDPDATEPSEPSEPEEDPEEIEPIAPSVFEVEISGNVTAKVASAEEAHVLKYVPNTSVKHHRIWSGLYRITGDEPTEIVISGLPEFESEAVEIRHYLDDVDAIRAAINNGSAKFFGTENREMFGAEICALEQATNGEKTGAVCYVVLSSEKGDVTVGENGTVTFFTDSFSLFEVSIVFVQPTDFTQAAELNKTAVDSVDNPYVVTDKNAFPNQNGGYDLVLESFVTGSGSASEISKTVPADIVLTVDLSESMRTAMDCGVSSHNGNMSNHQIMPSELAKSVTYYRNTSKGNPVYYCDACGGWFDMQHTSSHGGSRYAPVSTRGSTVYANFYTERDNAATVVDGANVDTSRGYYFVSGNKWYYTQYCEVCEAWINTDWLRPNESGDHSGGSYGHFNAKGTCDFDGTHSGGSSWYPKSSKFKYSPFYKACSPNRLVAAKLAMHAFLRQVYDSAKGPDGVWGGGDDVEHRVAITAFSGLYEYWGTAQTTGLYSVYDPAVPNRLNTFYPYYQIADEWNYTDVDSGYYGDTNITEPYKYVLRTVTAAEERDILEDAVDVLTFQYGTNTDYGVNMAKNIFEHNPTVERNRIFVAFTDGAPDRGTNKPSPNNKIDYGIWGDTGAAEPSLQYSKELKDRGITVYSIGIMSGANGTLTKPTATTPTITANSNNENSYMHLLSSNYLEADTMRKDYYYADLNDALKDAQGNLKKNMGYYLSASNADALIDAFVSIADQVQTEGSGADITTLNSNTQVQDVITPYFQIPAGAEITVHTESYTGNDANGNREWTKDENTETFSIDTQGNVVTVKGFDFSANYVGMDALEDLNGNVTSTPHGKKLVITVPIIPNPDFLGGDDVVTNETESAIYTADGTLVEPFPVPEVDVAVKQITPSFENSQIYVSQEAVLPYIANIGKFTVNGTPYSVNSINNDYVDITYTIFDGENYLSFKIPAGAKIEDLTVNDIEKWTVSGNMKLKEVLTSDKTYTIKCLVESINDRTHETESTGYPKIDVYTPVITFKDSVIRLGEAADYETENYVKIEWKHEGTAAVESEMGKAPTLAYTYDPAENAFEKDTPVNVTAAISPVDSTLKYPVPQQMDVLPYATFYREACDFSKCDHKALSGVTGTDPNFVVHLLRFDLEITKTGIKDVDNHKGSDETNAEWQSTIFVVKNEETGFEMEVVVHGNDTVKITGLPAATTEYTVEEKTDWSWRYVPIKNPQSTGVIETDNTTVKLTFENKRDQEKWLNGDFWCQNIFKDSGIKKTGNGV